MFSFVITFDGYTGAVEALVVDTNELTADSGAVVTAEVNTLQEGTEPLEGDFTLSFQGQETPALGLDATANEVPLQVVSCLEALSAWLFPFPRIPKPLLARDSQSSSFSTCITVSEPCVMTYYM